MTARLSALPALLLCAALGACGPATDPGTGPTTETSPQTSPEPTTGTSTEESTVTTSPDRHEAARAERPTTEALVREVAAGLTPQDPDAVAADDWVQGSTTACSWQAGGPVSWTGRGQMRAADPEAQVLALADGLDPRWEPVDASSTTARHFQDADGYLLTLSWGTDPDFINVSVESPCHG